MFQALLCSFVLVSVVAAKPTQNLFDGSSPADIHAVLVSGVPTSEEDMFGLNYAPEAEIARTYHWLVEHGVSSDNIILFLNGDFANNTELNPHPGTLYTDKNLTRNYAGNLKIDYSGDEVNTDNFLAVIRGEKGKTNGGSGRVLKSTEKSRVFISHEGHGGGGILALAESYLAVKDLHEALNYMQEKNMFKELVYYFMACQSGSMFEDQLKEDGPIYAFTAASPSLGAHPKDCYEDGIGLCFNTEFGDAWLNNVEESNTKKETLDQQYDKVVPQVQSDPRRYGNLKTIGKDPVAYFEGVNNKEKSAINLEPSTSNERQENAGEKIPIAPIAKYLLLKKQLKESTDFEEQKNSKEKLNNMEKERAQINSKIHSIIAKIAGRDKFNSVLEQTRNPPARITKLDCHHDVVETIWSGCKDIKKSAFFYEFMIPMVNLCEHNYPTEQIVEQIKNHC